jgi:hypothetical protein
MTATHERNETFEVEGDHLIRRVVPRRGRPYDHRCPQASFEQIAHAAEELGEQGFTLESLLEYERRAGRDVTVTNVAVTLAFLRERGILEVRFRRNYTATESVHLGAMTEFHALALDTAGRAKLDDRCAIRATSRHPLSQGLAENG